KSSRKQKAKKVRSFEEKLKSSEPLLLQRILSFFSSFYCQRREYITNRYLYKPIFRAAKAVANSY
ncbi:MAG: hypothetical protein WAQ09_09975, partial [Bacillota bacterium]